MQPSDISNKIWNDIVSGNIDCEFEFLALKFLLARLKLKVRYNPTEVTIQACADELKGTFAKYRHIPIASHDLEKLKKIGA